MKCGKTTGSRGGVRGFAFALVAVVAATACATEPQQGDLTSAIRDGARLAAVVGGTQGSSGTLSSLFDGVLSRSGSPKPWSSQRWYINAAGKPANGVVFTYDVPEEFVPGEQVVVTGVTFAVGWNTADGSGTGWYGNEGYHTRMPSAWTIEGSNDGGNTWTLINDVSGFNGYSDTRWYGEDQDSTDTNIGKDTYEGTKGFCNWRSFRKYRITITANRGATSLFCQLTEIKLHGIWGGTIPSTPPLVDLTAAARAVNGGTPSANVPEYDTVALLANAFNGSDSDGNRYLSRNAETLVALTNGGVWVCYAFNETFMPNADVVATGYTLDVSTQHAYSLERLPRAWKFQGSNDGTSWTTLDEHANFNLWQYAPCGNYSTIAFTFRFGNNASYRRYRILITRLWGDGPFVDERSPMPDTAKIIQFSEVAIFGHAGANIAGTLPQAEIAYPIDIMYEGRGNGGNHFVPAYSDSDHVPDAGYKLGNLFDNDEGTRILYTLDEDLADGEDFFPYVISYAMPDSFLAGKDIVVTNYTIETKKWNWATQRLPKSWRLEGFVGDRWVTLDRQENFTGWTIETGVYPGLNGNPADRLSASFDLPDNPYSVREYRLRILAVGGEADIGGNRVRQIQISELKFFGKWGDKLGKTPPCTIVILR